MVGRLSRIRVSSVTRTLPLRTSVGTLKSTRTSTRFPRTSRSWRVSFAISLVLLLVIDWICGLFFAQKICACGKFPKQSNEHLHDPSQLLFRRDDVLLS